MYEILEALHLHLVYTSFYGKKFTKNNFALIHYNSFSNPLSPVFMAKFAYVEDCPKTFNVSVDFHV
jgi:hypothetical protein